MKSIISRTISLYKKNYVFANSFVEIFIAYQFIYLGLKIIPTSLNHETIFARDLFLKNVMPYPWFIGYVLLFAGIYFLTLLSKKVYNEVKNDLKSKKYSNFKIVFKLIVDILVSIACFTIIFEVIVIGFDIISSLMFFVF